MICPKCGNNNMDGSTICIKCGTNLKNLNNGFLNPNEQPVNNFSSQPVVNEQPVNNFNSQSVINEQPVNNFSSQPILNEQPMNNFNSQPTNNSKKGFNPKIIIGLVVIVGIIAALIFLLPKKDGNGSNSYDPKDSKTFYLSDKNNKYALFNDSGKRLTGFDFDSIWEFYNGNTIVRKGDQYGIINSNGKMLVDFGKYTRIERKQGVYIAKDAEYNEFMLDSNGKMLYSLDKISYSDYYNYILVKDSNDNTYKILNSDGKEIFKVSRVEGNTDISTNEEAKHVAVNYNNKTYVISINSGKQIVSFDSDKNYCVNAASEDSKMISMNSCVAWYQSQDETTYKLIKDGKVYDLSDKCEKSYYHSGKFYCVKSNKTYELDSKMNPVESNSTGNVRKVEDGYEFYKDGKLVNTVKCRNQMTIASAEKEIYILESYYSRTCGTSLGDNEFFDASGNKLYDKKFRSATAFDANGLSDVSEKRYEHYLMETTGKKVSDDYYKIQYSNGYYIVTEDGSTYGLLGKNGEKILDTIYSNITINEHSGSYYALLKNKDSNQIAYDINKKSEIISGKEVYMSKNYIQVVNGEEYIYYTYQGKKFYSK